MRSFATRSVCALLSAGCLLMTGCNKTESTGAGYLFSFALPDNPACLDPQYTDNPNAAAILPSIMEGLVRLDESGLPELAGAESYTVSEDGLYYMFNLRTDCYWYNCEFRKEEAFPVTAQDYVFAFQRIFDKTTGSPYAGGFTCIKNAIPVITGLEDASEIGVSALDDYTVLFELDEPDAEFLQLLAQPCAYPCNEEFFYSTNGRYGLSAPLTLCNGPFLLTQWSYDPYGNDNLMYFKKNSTYYAADTIYPSQLSLTILRSDADVAAGFSGGSTDVFLTDLCQKQYIDSKHYTAAASRAQTLGLVFNPEHEILKNEDLRMALACGIDRASLTSVVSDDLEVAYGVIPPAVQVLGRSYRELYADEPLAIPYDPQQASELFQKASSKLQLHAMNAIQILVPSTITDTDALLTVCQEWQNLFGYYIGIESVTPEEFDKRIAAGEFGIALYSATGTRNSCRAVLEDFQSQPALFPMQSSDFSSIMQEIDDTPMLSDAAPLYYSAEEAIIAENLFIPLFYKNTYLYFYSENADLGFDAFTGAFDFRYAKHFED